MDTVYRDVHRIYFWHILITNDYSFGRHLHRSSNIDLGTWNVDLPDFSTRQSLSDINEDTQVYFEASLRLSLIEVKYSELVKRSNVRTAFFFDESELAEVRELLVEIEAVLAEWKIVSSNILLLFIWRHHSLTITGAIDDAGIFQNQYMALCAFDMARNFNGDLVRKRSWVERFVATGTRQGTRK